MKTVILKVGCGECISDSVATNLDKISYELSKCGHFVQLSVCISDSSAISSTFKSILGGCEAVLVCGDVSSFYDAMSTEYKIDRSGSVFVWGDTLCVISENCDDKFIHDVLIPALNGNRKTYYQTSVFKTIGKTEKELREILKNQIKNRNKISFRFVPNDCGYSVLVRYSNKTQKDTVNELLSGVNTLLKDCVYSYDDEVDLSEKVANILIRREKTLGLAESFTCGNIAASLVKTPGISKSLREGIVCYSNEAKKNRLRVSGELLENYGAVSGEVAYEMAANLLVDSGLDYVIATTGNAGPTSEKPDEVGVCYIAVGDGHTIDVYREKFDGDRERVIKCGTEKALYYFYKLLCGNSNEENQSSAKD